MTRVAVVGTGRIAEEHLSALGRIPGVDVVGVCDLDPHLAARAARIHGGEAYTSFEELLGTTRPDSVHITTPPHTHVSLAEQAILSGARLVVLEKPAALAAEELRRLLATAGEHGAVVVEDHNYRFNAPVQALAEVVDSGALGDVRAVEVRMSIPLATSRYQQRADRNVAQRMPGGVLHEFLPHLCYLGTWLAPGVDDVRATWSKRDLASQVSPDFLSISATGGRGERVDLLFESDVAPATTTVRVRGSVGWAEADLQLATLRASRPRGWGSQLDPLVDQARGGLAAIGGAAKSFRAKLAGSPIYEGIGTFVTSVYESHRSGTGLPVSTSDMLAAADLADAVLEQKP